MILLASFVVDRRTKQDFAFWGYLFGMLSFWAGLSLMESGSQLAKFGYCLINVGLMLVSILLQRRVFMVFGALGVFGYLGYLAYDVFKDSMSFPFVLSGLGPVNDLLRGQVSTKQSTGRRSHPRCDTRRGAATATTQASRSLIKPAQGLQEGGYVEENLLASCT